MVLRYNSAPARRVQRVVSWILRRGGGDSRPAAGRPGDGGDRYGACGQQAPALLAERCPAVWGQRGHVGSGRADAERERLPPVVEAGVADADSQRWRPACCPARPA